MRVEPVVSDVEFQIPAKASYVAVVRRAVRALVRAAGFDVSARQDIEVAVGEAVTNAVSYGSPNGVDSRVSIRCKTTDHKITIEVEDDGSDVCPPRPTPNSLNSREHGRGMHLIHRLMDRVSMRCSERGLTVKMVKRNRKHSAAILAKKLASGAT